MKSLRNFTQLIMPITPEKHHCSTSWNAA